VVVAAQVQHTVHDGLAQVLGVLGADDHVAKLARLWDPARPDENVEYYQSKVLETWERFRRFTEQDGLVAYVDDEPESPQLSLF